MPFGRLKRKTLEYYTGKIETHGVCPKGVDWKDARSQFIRFNQLLKVVDRDRPGFSLNDLGCGYGALLEEMQGRRLPVDYRGYDLSPAMIEAARVRFAPELPGGGSTRFFVGDELEPADYTVASGIFNVKQDIANEHWLDYVFNVIDDMDKASSLGFSFNMLTKYSDAEYMRDDLYYADPEAVFSMCVRKYSRWVSILHDYYLYEFTVIVRKEGR